MAASILLRRIGNVPTTFDFTTISPQLQAGEAVVLTKQDNSLSLVVRGSNNTSYEFFPGDHGTDLGDLQTQLDGLKIVSITPSDTAAYVSAYQLQNSSGTVLGNTINIPKDQMLDSVDLITSATQDDVDIDSSVVIGEPYIKFVFILSDSKNPIYLSVKDMMVVYSASTGVILDGTTFKGVVDSTSEAFLTVGTDGFKLSGVQTAIDAQKNRIDAHIGVGGVTQHPLGDGTTAGFSDNNYTTTEKTKLAGVADGAEVNQFSYKNIIINGTTITATGKEDTFEFEFSSDLTVTVDATNKKATVSIASVDGGSVTIS